MIRALACPRALVTLVLAASLTAPAYGQEPPPGQENDGLTREMFTDSAPPPPAPAPEHAAPFRQTTRRRLDSRHVRSVHHHARRHHRRAGKHSPVAAAPAAPAPRRRGPVVGFVYWWNGWVMRTFHTRFGTVMLGTVGAKS